jgi:hypothetical protein
VRRAINSTSSCANYLKIWKPQPPGTLRVCNGIALPFSFVLKSNQPQGHSSAGRIMSMKNSKDTKGNRNRDLPVCSAVPLPPPHRAPTLFSIPHSGLFLILSIAVCLNCLISVLAILLSHPVNTVTVSHTAA